MLINVDNVNKVNSHTLVQYMIFIYFREIAVLLPLVVSISVWLQNLQFLRVSLESVVNLVLSSSLFIGNWELTKKLGTNLKANEDTEPLNTYDSALPP